MRIEHVALWTDDLERLRAFYETYFGASAGRKYINAGKQFESIFLDFESGARIELMKTTAVEARPRAETVQYAGYCHLAISVGSTEQVESLTKRIAEDGFSVIGEPRWTGDGYYESIILDCDGNHIELTI